MNNFFLLNEAIETEETITFKNGVSQLINVKVAAKEHDNFYKHKSVYELRIWEYLFADYSQESQAILKFVEQVFKSCNKYLNSEILLDEEYPDMANAFLGFDFSKTLITLERQVTDLSSFEKFKADNLWERVDFRNFWIKRKLLYPHIILCGEVRDQISRIGTSGYFGQIIEKLRILDSVANEWKEGEFNYREVIKKFSLNISPESKPTLQKYGEQRRFKLPNGEVKLFGLHIKTGDLRFHFYADNENKEIYVGYIGPHLNTISN